MDDFVLLTTVGKGSFGKVIQVRKKDSGQIYAMKVLKKAQVIRRKQYEHTMTERHILEEVRWGSCLLFSFFCFLCDRFRGGVLVCSVLCLWCGICPTHTQFLDSCGQLVSTTPVVCSD